MNADQTISQGKISQACDRLKPFIRETPIEPSQYFSQVSGGNINFKLEQLQHSGSFKIRGAFNKILSLTPSERQKCLLTASSGNHGLAVAHVAKRLGLNAEIVTPRLASPYKLTLLKTTDVTLTLAGETGQDALAHARHLSLNDNYTYIPPYNDLDVIIGQSTLGYETMKQDPEIDIIVGSVGGGGLICGLAAGAKSFRPDVQVIGACAENASTFYTTMQNRSFMQGTEQPTWSDGTASALEADSITIPLALSLVDNFMMVPEARIRQLVSQILLHDRWLVEGAAALTVAAAVEIAKKHPHKKIAAILCGRNIDPEKMCSGIV